MSFVPTRQHGLQPPCAVVTNDNHKYSKHVPCIAADNDKPLATLLGIANTVTPTLLVNVVCRVWDSDERDKTLSNTAKSLENKSVVKLPLSLVQRVYGSILCDHKGVLFARRQQMRVFVPRNPRERVDVESNKSIEGVFCDVSQLCWKDPAKNVSLRYRFEFYFSFNYK